MRPYTTHLLLAIIVLLVVWNLYESNQQQKQRQQEKVAEILKESKSEKNVGVLSKRELVLQAASLLPYRDFIWHSCDTLKRIGGFPPFVQTANDPLRRIDGAWFVCYDKPFELVKDKCLVLSFGINKDESFDLEMNEKQGCVVYSFDPLIQAQRFLSIRASNEKYRDSLEVVVNDKWTFVNAGIVATKAEVKDENKRGGFLTFEMILDKYSLRGKVVDVFKMDIDGPEYEVIDNFDMDYMCKYVKQFVLETHARTPRPPEQPSYQFFKILSKLEKCFSMFYRHTRFFIKEGGTPTGWASEWQIPGGFSLDIHRFKNETDIALFMFVNGELYFLNENFL